MITSTVIDTTRVGMLVSPAAIARRALANFSRVVPLPSLTPNSPPTWPSATWMPTPVRNPMRTLWERKLAMNPSRMSRATIMKTPQIRAERPAIATHCGDPGAPAAAIPARPVAMTAAVAESAPTTRWRDEPKIAKAAIGRTRV